MSKYLIHMSKYLIHMSKYLIHMSKHYSHEEIINKRISNTLTRINLLKGLIVVNIKIIIGVILLHGLLYRIIGGLFIIATEDYLARFSRLLLLLLLLRQLLSFRWLTAVQLGSPIRVDLTGRLCAWPLAARVDTAPYNQTTLIFAWCIMFILLCSCKKISLS